MEKPSYLSLNKTYKHIFATKSPRNLMKRCYEIQQQIKTIRNRRTPEKEMTC